MSFEPGIYVPVDSILSVYGHDTAFRKAITVVKVLLEDHQWHSASLVCIFPDGTVDNVVLVEYDWDRIDGP